VKKTKNAEAYEKHLKEVYKKFEDE